VASPELAVVANPEVVCASDGGRMLSIWSCVSLLANHWSGQGMCEMRKQLMAGLACCLSVGFAGCSSNSSSSTATTTVATRKAAFCGGNIKIDKAAQMSPQMQGS